eukprot:6212889-Pleurochrysis_carterae.AAC.5
MERRVHMLRGGGSRGAGNMHRVHTHAELVSPPCLGCARAAIRECGDASVPLPGGDGILPFFHFANREARALSLRESLLTTYTLAACSMRVRVAIDVHRHKRHELTPLTQTALTDARPRTYAHVPTRITDTPIPSAIPKTTTTSTHPPARKRTRTPPPVAHTHSYAHATRTELKRKHQTPTYSLHIVDIALEHRSADRTRSSLVLFKLPQRALTAHPTHRYCTYSTYTAQCHANEASADAHIRYPTPRSNKTHPVRTMHTSAHSMQYTFRQKKPTPRPGPIELHHSPRFLTYCLCTFRQPTSNAVDSSWTEHP